MDKKLLTIEEVADYLNVKVSWVRSAIFRREIPYLKVGSLVRFRSQRVAGVDRKKQRFRKGKLAFFFANRA